MIAIATLAGVLVYMVARPEGRVFALALGVLAALCVPVLVFA